MSFVTIFGTDPAQEAAPQPVVAIPPHLQIVDKTGAVVASYDTTADFEEITANMTAINATLSAPVMAKGVIQPLPDPAEPAPEPVQFPVPDAHQQYQSLLYRCKLDIEMHNGQFPDDPWCLQEEQDDAPISVATPAVGG